MNNYKKSILLGLTLGDGCIYKHANNRNNSISYYISIKHGIKQREYLEHKASVINNLRKFPYHTPLKKDGHICGPPLPFFVLGLCC